MLLRVSLATLACACVDALVLAPPAGLAVSRLAARAAVTMEFGSGFGSYYSGWDDWVKEYPQVDKDAYPSLFKLPDNCYEICLMKVRWTLSTSLVHGIALPARFAPHRHEPRAHTI